MTVVFVASNHWYSKLIRWFERKFSDSGDTFTPSHAGLKVDGIYRESLASGFVATPLSQYEHDEVRIVDLDVEDDKLVEAGMDAFERYWGCAYGWLALISGMIYTATGKETWSDGEESMDCSEVVTRILRAFGFDIEGDVEADSITPKILYEDCKGLGEVRTSLD